VSLPDHFIPPHGGYRNLLSYQRAEVVYDATVRFCARFLDRRDRTVDQMVQAARSGKQNIIEGSVASGTSKEMEIKLTNVARASLEELLADYRDFLRTRNLPLWDKSDPRAQAVRRVSRGSHVSYASYASQIEQGGPEVAANTILCLIHQANYLLDQQIRQLEQAFLAEGGLRERMTRARLTERPASREVNLDCLLVPFVSVVPRPSDSRRR
jgi:four helix bundle suffix protein